jgi:predicted nucleotide-binding protein (sugar kinase/HSP70/actin superfamily)
VSRIGIPRTLAYFIYFPFWKVFFEELNQEVIVSSPTTREIMDDGVRDAVTDACIPIKLYHGHVADIASQVDYIFGPRLVSVRKHGDFGTETFCPKFLGLPDMVRLSMDNIPEIIDVRVDLKQGKDEFFKVCSRVGVFLGKSEKEVKKAYHRALKVQKRFKKLLYQNIMPPDAMDILFAQGERKPLIAQPDLQIAVVGYPYVIYDDYINGRIVSLLEKENVKIYTQDMLSDKIMNRQARNIPKSMFWYFSNRAVYGALHYMQQKNIDGIIHITAFACGPDAIVDRLLEIEAKRHGQVPYLAIMVDEHTGDAGVRTRVEAFLDMLRFRRDKS